MQREFISRTGSMTGVSDLTVMAPIIPGLVPAMDAVTYKSRVKRVLKALHTGRLAAHEFDLARVLSDAVERVGRIHSVRIAVLEPEGDGPDYVLLAVTFDGAWEAYVRVIWQKVARLLDLIFCNTQDYRAGGWLGTYEEWGTWLRSRQVETPFLYAQPFVTTDDVSFLRMHERLQRREPDADLQLAQAAVPSAEEIADRLMITGADPTNLGTSIELEEEAQAKPEAFRQGMRALAGLYRLADLYPPATPEGDWLLRAAHELLPEFSRLLHSPDLFVPGIKQAKSRFGEQLDWFATGFGPLPAHRALRPPPATSALRKPETVQGGIVTAHDDVSHGVLLLLSFETRQAQAKFLADFTPTTEAAPAGPGAITHNIAISLEGMRLAGLDDAQVRELPEEFIVGMDKRAGWLGDVRVNHPQRWRLPALNWSAGVAAADPTENDPAPRIDLGAVHVAVQLRLRVGADGKPATDAQGRATLLARLQELVAACPGAMPLSLQWMHRLRDQGGGTVEHFGFGDGGSDPVFDRASAGTIFRNHVHVGEALVGYENAADAAPPTPPKDSVAELLFNGSFLVVRKLRQDLGALEQTVARSVHGTSTGCPALERDTLLAKMMGRWPSGNPQANLPLADPDATSPNDFNYVADPGGDRCPLQAHIRRANPRGVAPAGLRPLLEDGARPPRIFRRSLSYGAPRDATGTNLGEERGLVFMAYNASIGEQFEVVQRWLAGGNSSGALSSMSDPFLGLAEPGRKRIFAFPSGANVERVHLDGDDDLHAEPRPLVRLEWGGYFFAPSTDGLKALAAWKSTAERASRGAAVPWSVEEGRKAIEALQAITDKAAARKAWKEALEDTEAALDFRVASIWAAIRALHGGVLSTEYGTLVASDAKVREMLQHPDVSARGYLPAMRNSFGEIYLGLDESPRYQEESTPCNDAIQQWNEATTFQIAGDSATGTLAGLVAEAKAHALDEEQARRNAGVPPRAEVPWNLTVDVTRELVDPLLATFCEEWFGLSEAGGHFKRGHFSWTQTPVVYPGHFMAPSRYFFQPYPGEQAKRLGHEHGEALRAAMKAFLAQYGPGLTQPVVRAVLDSPEGRADADFAARTLVGAIMGFVPTVNGSLRRILNEWLRDGTFWTLRAQRSAMSTTAWSAALDTALMRAMQLRALPETVWRTLKDAKDQEGSETPPEDLPAARVLVLGTLSAAHERLEQGKPGVETIFGGDRSAPQPRPTHACPGMKSALAMMKGFLDALLASPLPMRSGLAPLTLAFDGKMPGPGAGGPAQALERAGGALAAAPAVLRIRTLNVWTIGDSWLTALPGLPDIVGELADLGFVRPAVSREFAKTGRSLADMASQDSLDAVVDALNAYRPPHPAAPRAILLGGGGNDIVQPEDEPTRTALYKVLVDSPTSAATALNLDGLDKFVNVGLKGCYMAILGRLTGVTSVPILIHGYDRPFPDGRPATIFNGPWLQRVFVARSVPEAFRRPVMATLINELNKMLVAVAGAFPGKVHYAGFSGLLEQQPGFNADYTVFWHDELHPQDQGCRVIAAQIAAKLATLGVTP